MAPDIARAVRWLFGLAVVSVILAGAYNNHYLFRDPSGIGLPDINVSSSLLTVGMQVSAITALLWALLLTLVGTPGSARALVSWWERRVQGERTRPKAAALAAALALAYAAARWGANEETLPATLEMFASGEAKTPFQYRALVPWLVRGATEVVPSLPLAWCYGFIEACAAFGVYLAFRVLLRSFVRDGAARRVAALSVFLPLALNLATPYRYNAIYFPYDTPSVAFFTAGLALMLQRKWWVYYLVFVVATLNRETTCFLTLGFLWLAVGRERPAKVLAHVAAQAAIWVGIKYGLHTLYLANDALNPETGGLFSNQLERSGRILLAVPSYVYVLLVSMGGAGAVVALLWRRVRASRLRRLFGVVPFFLSGMVVVGELMEVRIYSELIPLVTVALVLIVRSVAQEASRRSEGERHGQPVAA